DLDGSGTADIVAGYSQTDPRSPKLYQVATATTTLGVFGTELPQFEGNIYKVNSPTHPNLEFSIIRFSQLYQQVTGRTLTPGTTFNLGGFAGSANDTGISEAFFPAQAVTISAATPPTATCPPQSPTIYVNPHEHRIIDTRHRDLVRVSIVGTSGFNVRRIDPASVRFDSARAIAHLTRKVPRSEFPIATYVFQANQLNVPPGVQNVTLSGTLRDGTTFQS